MTLVSSGFYFNRVNRHTPKKLNGNCIVLIYRSDEQASALKKLHRSQFRFESFICQHATWINNLSGAHTFLSANKQTYHFFFLKRIDHFELKSEPRPSIQ